MRQRRTIESHGHERLQIWLRGPAAREHLRLRELLASRTDAEIYQLLVRSAGTPALRALELVEHVVHAQSDALGEDLVEILLIAAARCKQIVDGQLDASTVQTQLFSSDHEVKA